MIQLKTDCLIFQTNDGDSVPCPAEWVVLELMGESADLIDPEVVRNASEAVLHYFKHELNRQSVSVGEFAIALEKVLRSFGLSVHSEHSDKPADIVAPRVVVESNLQELASQAATEAFELVFYPQLRRELQRKLEQSPHVLRFHGLRDCVKQLAGAARWNRRCQNMHDQIVDFLRTCWETESAGKSCALMVV